LPELLVSLLGRAVIPLNEHCDQCFIGE
jgi:hypothetical protein